MTELGATFCNLYCKNEHVDILRERQPKDSRLLTGYGEWAVLLLKEYKTRTLMYLARYIPGDVLIFMCYDDEAFGLYYYRDGKKTAFLDCGEYNTKVRTMAANLFPDDPQALKKLWAVKRGVSVDEKLTLLEETFGLPFYAVYEDEEIAPVKKSSKTFDIMNARAKELRNRPNLYSAELLPAEEWPESVKNGEGRQNEYNPYKKIMTNRNGDDIYSVTGKGVVCKDGRGNEKWSFFPEQQLEPRYALEMLAGKEAVTVIRHDHTEEKPYAVWSVSPEDGSVQAERVFTGEIPYGLRWWEDMDCYIYTVWKEEIYVFLDKDFNEIRRTSLKVNGINFINGRLKGHYIYKSNELPDQSYEVLQADFDNGEVKQIKLELPVYPQYFILSKECLCCGATGFTFDSNIFFGWDGKVISRNRVENIWGIWEEDGKIYGLSRMNGHDTNVKVYLFREKEKNN